MGYYDLSDEERIILCKSNDWCREHMPKLVKSFIAFKSKHEFNKYIAVVKSIKFLTREFL